MFLKSLEVRGFKSFADKTELKFNKGITAVVGPNGSGKSNVSDAVRWVLGEQSVKTLRGSKMEDIIFIGTQYRKAIGLASVSLTLDNSDSSLPLEFNEIKVTRRIYRSGESEYLINNTSCRLKDIINLFMDTGIGKEGYSLIGQGKIDAILSGKTEDRRILLEEAAGIVKYKTRKVEAEKRLKNTTQNLMRINDIIFTYEEMLIPLEAEKKKAEKYLYFSSELDSLDINLLINNIIIINDKIKNENLIIKTLEKENKIEKLKNINIKENLKKLKAELEKIETDNKEKNNIYNDVKDKITNLKSKITLIEERIKSYNEQTKKIKKDINESENKIIELENNLKFLEKDIDNEVNELEKNTYNLNLKELEQNKLSKEIILNQKEIANIKEKDLEIIKAEASYQNKKAVLENKLENIKENISLSGIKKDSFESALKINIILKNDLDKNIECVLKSLKSLKAEESEILEVLNKKKIFANKKSEELDNEFKLISKLETNKEILERLDKSYEGYSFSVKKVMAEIENKNLKVNKNSVIVLGEIISVNKGYETAIETSLLGSISNIITDDEYIAKTMIDYLKVNKLGRATFLPISTIKGRKIKIDKELQNFDGYIGIASDIVKYDEKYEEIINYILGRIIICRNLESGLILAKKIGYKYKLVTLEGDVVNAGGALTGGSSQQKNLGIISRKLEIEKINSKILIQKDNYNNFLIEQKKILNEISKKELFVNNLNEKIKDLNIEVLNFENEIKRVKKEIIDTINNIKTIQEELNKFNIKRESILIENLKIEKEYKNKQNISNSDGNNIDKLTIKLENTIKNKDNIDKEITVLKVNNASLKTANESKKRELERINKEILDNKFRVENFINLDKNILEKIELNKKEIFENKSMINYESENLANIEEKSKSFEVYRVQIKDKISKFENEVELLTLKGIKNDEEIHKQKIIFTKYESEKENSILKLEEEYNINIDDEINKYTKIDNIDKHKNQIYSLKSKISSLGNISINSINEFKELKEKYKYITTERADLENAKEELLKIIEDMTSKMKVIFRQNLNIINNNFDSTFKDLFNGGSAKLILNQDDELNSDIEIKVQPPGKKIQNINLMSGGEKVLSAIALLFAILKMKPTPFCILDEIEAALDDANVTKYAEFLKKFAKDIQFIVITHRKGTMEVADIMYGVTMEEKGISKIVSVDLNKK
ncbi:MAG: chromosome segregation protein SMC [Sarcina sp.]